MWYPQRKTEKTFLTEIIWETYISIFNLEDILLFRQEDEQHIVDTVKCMKQHLAHSRWEQPTRRCRFLCLGSGTRLLDFLANYFSSSSQFSLIYFLFKDIENFLCLCRTQRQLMISQGIMSLFQNLSTLFDVKGTIWKCFQEAFKATISLQGILIHKNGVFRICIFELVFSRLPSIHPYLDQLFLCCS